MLRANVGFQGRPVPQQIGSQVSGARAHCRCLGSLSLPASCILFTSLVLIATVFIICSNTGRLNCLKGIILLHKAATHEPSAHILFFCFCLKKEKKACHQVRCAGIQCLAGPAGSQSGSSPLEVPSARLAGLLQTPPGKGEGEALLSSRQLPQLICARF